jgi:hypothetical protein
MAEPPRVRVTFRKQVSDGNYGTEAAEYTLECDQMDGVADALLQRARALVHAELNRSPSPSVRRALEPPPPLAGGAPMRTAPDGLEDLPF